MSTLYYARMLDAADDAQIVELAKQHHAGSRYSHLPFEEVHVYKLCEACRTLPHYGCVVLEGNGSVVGYAAAVIEPYLWSDIKIARDLAVYITPIARSLASFRALVLRLEMWAAQHYVHTVDLGISTSPEFSEVQRLGKVYQRIGYEPSSEHYRKEIA